MWFSAALRVVSVQKKRKEGTITCHHSSPRNVYELTMFSSLSPIVMQDQTQGAVPETFISSQVHHC